MSKSALIGRNSSVVISGIDKGYIRDYSSSATVDVVDASGIGDIGSAWGSPAPFRTKIVTFADGNFSVNGMTNGSGGNVAPGAKISVTTDWYSFGGNGLVTSCDSSSSYDNLVLISISGTATA